jgi:hypothetical protein
MDGTSMTEPGNVTEDPQRWLLRALEFYRPLGFFARYAGLTDGEVARRLQTDRLWADGSFPGQTYDPAEPHGYNHPDLDLLHFDVDRCWVADMEGDYIQGNDFYVRDFKAWAAISRGLFQPEDVKEKWRSEIGPAEISFKLHGKAHRITVQSTVPDDVWLDAQIFVKLNKLMLDSQRGIAPENRVAFCTADTGDQMIYVIAASDREIAMIDSQRGLKLKKETWRMTPEQKVSYRILVQYIKQLQARINPGKENGPSGPSGNDR